MHLDGSSNTRNIAPALTPLPLPLCLGNRDARKGSALDVDDE